MNTPVKLGLLAALLAAPAWADTLQFTNGEEIWGTLLQSDTATIRFESGGVAQSYPRSGVARIQMDANVTTPPITTSDSSDAGLMMLNMASPMPLPPTSMTLSEPRLLFTLRHTGTRTQTTYYGLPSLPNSDKRPASLALKLPEGGNPSQLRFTLNGRRPGSTVLGGTPAALRLTLQALDGDGRLMSRYPAYRLQLSPNGALLEDDVLGGTVSMNVNIPKGARTLAWWVESDAPLPPSEAALYVSDIRLHTQEEGGLADWQPVTGRFGRSIALSKYPEFRVRTADFVTSAPSIQEAPPSNLPEFVLLGRSNVGKSSFINALLGRKGLAKTSNTPGKTRLINFYRVEMTRKISEAATPKEMHFHLVDLPGYGYAKVSKTEQERWQKALNRYLLQRENITLCYLLIDARHGLTDNDHRMLEWLGHNKLPVQPVLTKIDKEKQQAVQKNLREVAQALSLPNEDVFLFAAPTRKGVDTVLTQIGTGLLDEAEPDEA